MVLFVAIETLAVALLTVLPTGPVISMGGSNQVPPTVDLERTSAAPGGNVVRVADRPNGSQTPRVPLRPYSTPRELLILLGLDNSLLDSFADESVPLPGDQEAMLRLLDRMDSITRDDIARWQHDNVPWSSLRTQPAQNRFQFYRIAGRARNVRLVELDPRLADLFGWRRYYEVKMDLSGGAGQAVVYTRTIPRAWRERTKLDERAGAVGLFLRRGAGVDSSKDLVFAARRVAWYPDRLESQLGVGAGQVVLGDLSFDVGLFDTVTAANGKPFETEEKECFYQLLAATKRSLPGGLDKLAQPLELDRLLQHPETAHGVLFRVPCTVVCVTEVSVTDKSIQRRLGVDRYYQIDALLTLDNQIIVLQNSAADAKGPVYRACFPVTFCAARLPRSWQAWVNHDSLRQDAVITGCFYKLWVYPSAFVAKFDAREGQLSPVLIGMRYSTTVLAAPSRAPNWGLAVAALFIVGLVVVWLVAIRTSRSDRRAMRRWRERRVAAGVSPSFDMPEKHDESTDESTEIL